MRRRLAPEVEQELERSSVYRWATRKGSLSLRALKFQIVLVLCSGFLVLAVPGSKLRWTLLVACGIGFMVVGVADFAHTVGFERALEEDHLLSPAAKGRVKVKLLVIPFGVDFLIAQLAKAAERRLKGV